MTHAPKEIPEASIEEKARLVTKLFLTRDEFKAILGIKACLANKMWADVKEKIQKEFESSHPRPILPDSKHLPTALVFKYLAPYGIKRSQFERR